MHIHRGILLVLVVIFIFSPTIQDWVSNNAGQWYRPFIVWAVVIGFAYLSQRRANKS
ncbi:MAG: hypothetical protein OXE99_09055 [Cellvibrionales bacterium]|nr:hypothetical protein [Cellvibrionales bacterium]